MFDSTNIGALQGAPVFGPDDEKIGTVGQVYIDSATERPTWVSVKTGWFGTHETFVPLADAGWDNERLRVPIDKETLKAAPRFDTGSPLSRADEEALYRFYDARSPEGAPDSGGAREARRSEGDEAGASDTGASDTGTSDTGASDASPASGRAPDASGGVRLRKYVVTDYRSVTVPVTREEVRLEPEGPDTPDETGAPGEPR